MQKEQLSKKEQELLNSKRTKCLVYSRVMWFIRPVDYFNQWKKSEFYSRKYFEANNQED